MRTFLLVTLMTVAACGSSTSASSGSDASAKPDARVADAGSGHDAGGDSGRDAGSKADSGPTETFTTTCTPMIDVSKAKNLMPALSYVYQQCYVGTPPASPLTVDSNAALTALFKQDAGAPCNDLMLPTVDYTTDRVVLLAAAGVGTGDFTVYQTSSGTVFDVGSNEGGGQPIAQVFLVVLPIADTTSIQVMTCTTTCSGECPG
jgi:hypothetical protein